jgi:flagellar hook-associated protein 2
MSNTSISGAISGIDTASLVNQLMTVEAQSQTNIKTKQTAAQTAADAYTGLITSLKSLATQSAALAKTSTWAGSTATSSNASVTAKTSGNAVGTITFDVSEIASAHTLISAADSSAASTSSIVAAGGVLTVNDADGTAKGTINVGTGSLSEVVAGINGSKLGLRAAAVQTAPGEFRLQVTSATSGKASAFSLDGLDGFSGMNVLTTGTDALLTIGKDDATKYTVTSATNTFSDLLPGVSFTVSKKGESDVTVDAKLDGTAVADSISKMVDATNAALTSLASSTSYDFTKKTGAALYGDNSIKGLQQQILSSVGGANAPGVQLTRDGKLTFDQSVFLKAFQADPTGTAAAYGATSSFTPNTGVLGKAALLSSGDATKAGKYAVQVSVAAAKEKWTATPSGNLDGQTIVITQGSLTASYTVGAGKTLADAVSAINTRAAAAGIGTTASVDAGSIVFSANSPGIASAFNVSIDGTPGSQVTAGRNVVGSIDGLAATGNGNTLTLANTASQANGLRLTADVSDDDVATSGGNIGDVTFKPGLAQRLSTLLNDATDSATGALTQAKAGRLSDIKDFQDQIDAWDIRLAARKATLTRQFTAMETALSKLKSSSSAITNLLADSGSSSSS